MLGVQFLLPGAPPPADPAGLAARRTRPVTVPPLQEYAAILASPIFAPDRKPAPSGASAPGAGSLAGWAALGAAAGRGVASGVVAVPVAGIKTLRRGEEIDGWRLVAVSPTALTFERNGQRHALVVGAPAEAGAAASGPAANENEAPQ